MRHARIESINELYKRDLYKKLIDLVEKHI